MTGGSEQLRVVATLVALRRQRLASLRVSANQ